MCFEDQLSPISDPMTKGEWFSATLQLQGRVSMTSASTRSSASPSPAWTRQRARRHHVPGLAARLQGAAHELHAHIDGIEGHSFSYCRFGMHPCATACKIEVSTSLSFRRAHRTLRLFHSNYVQPQKAHLPGCEGQRASLGLHGQRRCWQLVLQCPLLRTCACGAIRWTDCPHRQRRLCDPSRGVQETGLGLWNVKFFYHSQGSLKSWWIQCTN
ncbi:hypothetical protein V8E53_007615 [Lactarius tabidus]